MAFFDIPVEFVTTLDDGSLTINKDVTDYLKTISNKKVTVVAIVGEARKGKSFLMNRLMGSNSGFPLGPTVHSTTKGIWICMRPHPRDASRLLILLDTEGLGDPDKNDHTHDCWIFALALLFSSTFVYNSVGTINKQSLDFLQLAAEMTENIKMKKGTEEENGKDFGRIFPELIWVLRDFFLGLKDPAGKTITPNEYLESCLALEKGRNIQEVQRNFLKGKLREFFTNRSCFLFPRPVTDDEQMLILDTLQEGDLDSRFLAASKHFTDYILGSSKNKTVDGVEISADFFALLAEQYVEAVQTKFVCIESAVNAVKAVANQKAMDEALKVFEQELIKIGLPLSPEGLREAVKPGYGRAREHFLAHAFGIGKEEADRLLESLEERITLFEVENVERCEELCSGLVQTLYQSIQVGLNDGSYMVPGGHKKLSKDVDGFVLSYRSERRVKNLGQPAEAILKRFLDDKVDPILKHVLASDRSLSQKEKENQEVKQHNERLKRQAELVEQEKEDLKARMDEAERQRKEDEKRIRQEQKEANEAMMKSQKDHYEEVMEESHRLLKEGHAKEAEAMRQQMTQLTQQIAALAARPQYSAPRRRRCVIQ